ncbi:hypothetical protein P280DRAFT_330005 [Massarina eburnea CBS 473.64]|uniref:Uncharacterized protein n=1 Tax=Massarina eburnea CBS 473.64 TaxID=1395130 RepID=A0A6A6S0H0_9PLEO|nr:hypothetical protein P280DRAFT_330005 [Massarina eburnea CBS 473.64]
MRSDIPSRLTIDHASALRSLSRYILPFVRLPMFLSNRITYHPHIIDLKLFCLTVSRSYSHAVTPSIQSNLSLTCPHAVGKQIQRLNGTSGH